MINMLNAEVLDPEWTTELIYNFSPELEYAESLITTDNEYLLHNEVYATGF